MRAKGKELSMEHLLFDKIYGSLVGGIIGDSMGGPTEFKTWQEIEEAFGWVSDFKGAGTDDSAIKQLLCNAIIENKGHVSRDEFAASLIKADEKTKKLFFVSVHSTFMKLLFKVVKPIEAGRGNMPSSSTAMIISPLGMINACNPRQAAMEAYEAAGLIHSGQESDSSRQGAAAIAAATAEAFRQDASVDSVLAAATAYLHQESAAELITEINRVTSAARAQKDYKKFREWYYENSNMKQVIICDARETVPVTLAIFCLAEGDHERAVTYAANFGRDADTIGTMAGAMTGAFKGASAIRADWLKRIEAAGNTEQLVSGDAYGADSTIFLKDQKELAKEILAIAMLRHEETISVINAFNAILK